MVQNCKARRGEQTAVGFKRPKSNARNHNSILFQVGIVLGLRLGIIDRAAFGAEIEHIFIFCLCGRIDGCINRGATRITNRPSRKSLTGTVIGIIGIAIGSIATVQIFIFSNIISDIGAEIYRRCIHLKLHALCKAVMQHGGNAFFIRICFCLFFNDGCKRQNFIHVL